LRTLRSRGSDVASNALRADRTGIAREALCPLSTGGAGVTSGTSRACRALGTCGTRNRIGCCADCSNCAGCAYRPLRADSRKRAGGGRAGDSRRISGNDCGGRGARLTLLHLGENLRRAPRVGGPNGCGRRGHGRALSRTSRAVSRPRSSAFEQLAHRPAKRNGGNEEEKEKEVPRSAAGPIQRYCRQNCSQLSDARGQMMRRGSGRARARACVCTRSTEEAGSMYIHPYWPASSTRCQGLEHRSRSQRQCRPDTSGIRSCLCVRYTRPRRPPDKRPGRSGSTGAALSSGATQWRQNSRMLIPTDLGAGREPHQSHC
jgi:hypothetical protein